MMKTISIIAQSLNDYQILKPLMRQFQKDQNIYLTIILMDRHKNCEMEIIYTHIEEEGFIVYENSDILFKDKQKSRQTNPFDMEQAFYDNAFEFLNPDMVVLYGNSYQTFQCAIAASQKDIPIAHIQGGESNFGIFNDSYGYGITKLSHLHLTAAQKYRQQVIQFGEHADRVFNVGSLIIEKIKNLPLEKKSFFYDKSGLKKNNDFLLISFHPDPAMGSRNVQIFHEILESLSQEKLKNFKLLFNKPKTDGLGKIIIQMIDNFIAQNLEKTTSVPYMNLPDLSSAIINCSAVIGNDAESLVIAPSFQIPVINIGEKLQGRIKTKNIIDCIPNKKDILQAIQNGLSTDFKLHIQDVSSPFEQTSTARKIKDLIKDFTRSDIALKNS